ncbi:MAG: putative Ig domain-containing protein, partial [Micrococcales bacterium]|nr:putative Ig domain-containing protein [Micrococcales bacterium]
MSTSARPLPGHSRARRVATAVVAATSLALSAVPAVAGTSGATGVSATGVAQAPLVAAAPADDIAAEVVKAINEERAKATIRGRDEDGNAIDIPAPMKPLKVLDCTTQQAAQRVDNRNTGQIGLPDRDLKEAQDACALHSDSTGATGPAGASGQAIVAGWKAAHSSRPLGAFTHVGVACSNKNTKSGEWLCEAIFSNPALVDGEGQPVGQLPVMIFGDSYTAGNGVGGGDNKMNWRGMNPWNSATTTGKKTTRSYQSSKSQGRVLAGLVANWTGRPLCDDGAKDLNCVIVDDYSHTGSVTASKDSKPWVFEASAFPEARMRTLLNNNAVFYDDLKRLLDDPSGYEKCKKEDETKDPDWGCGGADAWARKNVSGIMTLEDQINEAEMIYKVLPPAEGGEDAMYPQGIFVFGIGGNDIAFARIAEVALVFPFSEPDVREALAAAEGLMEPAMVRAEEQLIRLIENASPNSVIMVQGYPYLANGEGSPTIYGCKLDGKFVDAALYCSGDGAMGNQGTKTEYQPADDIRRYQNRAEDRLRGMVNNSKVSALAKAYGVELQFVPYASPTDGQAPYLANGGGNPSRGITKGFEAGDARTFSLDKYQFIHPTARLRAQEGELLFQSLIKSTMPIRQSILGTSNVDARADNYIPRLTIPAGALPAGRVGEAYGIAFQAEGGIAPRFSVTTPNQLPSGLRLHSSGALSGTPSRAGDYTFTIRAENQIGSLVRRDEATYTLHIDERAPDVSVVLKASTPPTATVGSPYTFVVEATGSPAPTFAVTGDLPPGLRIYPATGTISGTPALPGDYTVTIVASNVVGRQVQTSLAVYTFHVELAAPDPEPSVIVSGAAPAGKVGEAYAFTVEAEGFPAPVFAVTEGDLPPGLELDLATGAVTGTPTAVGEYVFTVTASNVVGSDSVELTIQVSEPDPVAPVITFGAAPAGTVEVAYAFTVEATGYPLPTFAVTEGDLPP